jgi:hypothetical protein
MLINKQSAFHPSAARRLQVSLPKAGEGGEVTRGEVTRVEIIRVEIIILQGLKEKHKNMTFSISLFFFFLIGIIGFILNRKNIILLLISLKVNIFSLFKLGWYN